jgi:hypothetical protein
MREYRKGSWAAGTRREVRDQGMDQVLQPCHMGVAKDGEAAA